MVRDYDLLRKILVHIEREDEVEELRTLTLDGYDIRTTDHHLRLLINHGYVDGDINTEGDGTVVSYRALTMSGHDLAEAMENNIIWTKAKTVMIEKGGKYTFAMIGELLKNLARQHLGI